MPSKDVVTEALKRVADAGVGRSMPHHNGLLRSAPSVALVACALIAATSRLAAQQPDRSRGRPRDPIGAIAEMLRSHRVVAIGNVEFRGDEQSQAFLRSLVRDARFPTRGTDIVVEFGNARYQPVIDRFVRGEDVPLNELRQVWQNTTQIEWEWDLPIYEEFFRTVRAVNAPMAPSRRVRVILADPPIDWTVVSSKAALDSVVVTREDYAAETIRREVLSKHRRALVVFGAAHLLRSATPTTGRPNGLVERLERDGATVFTVIPEVRRDLTALDSSASSWPIPSLVMLRGTTLGAAHWPRPDGRATPMLQDQADAILYLGPPSTMTSAKLPATLCADTAYMTMRLSRLALLAPPPGAPMKPADMLRSSCDR